MVNNLTVPSRITEGSDLVVTIKGSLPSPAWKFEKAEIQQQGNGWVRTINNTSHPITNRSTHTKLFTH